MSIIADTLRRLQTQSEEPPPKPKDNSVPRPAFNKGEGTGRHRKDSPFGFLMVMVGMTITLGSLAVAAFWIGGHLDFGLATNTQARINNHRPLLSAPELSENPALVDQSSETQAAAVEEPVHIAKTSTTPEDIVEHSASISMDSDSSIAPQSLPEEVTTPALPKIAMKDLSTAKVILPTTSQDQEDSSDTIDQPIANNEESMSPLPSDAEEPSSDTISPELPTITTEDSVTDIAEVEETEELAVTNDDVAEQTDEPETPNLVAALSEEEIIQTEEFVEASAPLTDSAPQSTTLAALKERRESLNDGAPTSVPSQPSPVSRLRHAQKMIRTGEYEDAVALLSPLFQNPPVKWQPWFWMGTALLGKGDMEQADQYFLSGLARNDKVPQLWIQRALVAQQRGDFQLAIHELRQAESIDADIPHIHLNMGYAYERLGNDRLANQYYGKFLKLSEGKPTFFPTRKKLFARLTQKTPTVKLTAPFSPKP